MSRRRISRVDSPHEVPFDGSFRVRRAPTAPPDDAPGKADNHRRLEELVEELSELQRVLYASNQHAVLLLFQAMDAAGKDGTIRHVLSGVNPAGFQVHSFKQPSDNELDHDFLWRCARRLPERGRIGVFNRSHYEEVLVVRVHPEFLAAQRLPDRPAPAKLWKQRFESIRNFERHLARNGTLVLKFWLNVSRQEQHERFLERLEEPRRHWKFSEADLAESELWDDYMHAYEEALNATSRAHAPWFAIPADKKHYMRVCVAEIVVAALRSLDLQYPVVDDEVERRFEKLRQRIKQDM